MGDKLRIWTCVENWPDCASGQYNPACCRFPKSCSCTSYRDEIDPALLEDPAPEHHVGTLDLSGEGNAPRVASPISDDLADLVLAVNERGVPCPPNCDYQTHRRAEVRAELEAAYPAIRRQVAEEIAAKLDERYRANLALSGGDRGIPREGRIGVATGYQRAAEIAREIGGRGADATAPGRTGATSGRTGVSAAPSDPPAGKAGRSESGGFEG